MLHQRRNRIKIQSLLWIFEVTPAGLSRSDKIIFVLGNIDKNTKVWYNEGINSIGSYVGALCVCTGLYI